MALLLEQAGWLGPRTGELGWLFSRMESRVAFAVVADTQTPDQLSRTELDEVFHSPVQRLVLACENRWDLPLRQLDYLRSVWPEVPVALATSGWWEGAERTGAGQASVLRLPWYRWWDGWLPWLQGDASHWFSASPGVPHLQLAFGDSGDHRAGRFANGCIVCDHVELAQAWHLAAGSQSTPMTLADMRSLDSAESFGWILLDDSSLHTVAHRRGDAQWAAWVREVRRNYPTSRIVCAMNQPEWSVWRGAMEEGADELLGKPLLGEGLLRAIRGAGFVES